MSMSTVPIKETKDTAKFSRLVHESDGVITVTKNGREDYIALKVEEYDALRYKAAMADLYAKLIVSEREAAEGKVSDFDDFRNRVREQYGF